MSRPETANVAALLAALPWLQERIAEIQDPATEESYRLSSWGMFTMKCDQFGLPWKGYREAFACAETHARTLATEEARRECATEILLALGVIVKQEPEA